VATYESDAAILRLRDEIKKTGNKEAYREINYAIRSDRRHYDNRLEYWLNYIFFDLTVGYGLFVSRPLIILAFLVPIFAAIYLLMMTKKSPRSGIFIELDEERIGPQEIERNNSQITLEQPYPDKLVVGEFFPIIKERPELAEKVEGQPLVSSFLARLGVLWKWIWWEGPEERTKVIRKAVRGYVIANTVFWTLFVGVLVLPWLGNTPAVIHDAGKLTVNFSAIKNTKEITIHRDEAIQTGVTHQDFVAYASFLALPLLLSSLYIFRNKEARQAWRMAVWFSLLSAFKFGWRDLSVGTWLAMLQAKNYSFRAVGLSKTLSGFESLLGLVMVGLWAFCYFVGPLE
jgi:hypothetical protein